MTAPILAKNSPAWERRGFSKLPVIVVELDELHNAYLVDDEKTGERRRVPADRLSPRGGSKPRTGSVVRTPCYERPPAPSPRRLRQRRQPWRSREYLAFVRRVGREEGCINCEAREEIEAAHFGPDGGGSLKPSDCYAAPICRCCHRSEGWHQHGTLPGRTREESEDLQRRAQLRLMCRWLQGERA